MHAEPTLRQLRHFLSLCDHLHFGRAATACLVTQSSLSASIKELENILQTVLFERTKRTVLLTGQGHNMVPYAKSVIAEMDALTDAIKGARPPLTGPLTLGVIPTISPYLLPRVLPELRKSYPQLNVYLREEQTADLLAKLIDGQLDLVLMALPYNTQRLETFAFADDPFLAVFPRGHAMEAQETITPKRINADEVLMLEPGNCLTQQTLGVLPDIKHKKAELFQATSLHTLVQMVEGGLGVMVLPKMAVDAGILRGTKLNIRPFSSPKASRQIALVWRKASLRRNEFITLAKFFRDELGTPLRG